MIRVLIVDDHPVIRRGLASLLGAAPGIDVIGAAANGEEAVTWVAESRPDVVLMDVSMPGMSGMEAARRVLEVEPDTRVVMLTSFSQRDVVVESFDAGAVGYLLKDVDPEELVSGIRAAARGDAPLSPKAARELLEDRANRRPLDELTQRERDVLALVGKGMANKQIAWRLGITEKTVKAHLGSIFDRLGVQDRTQAAIWAQKHGIA